VDGRTYGQTDGRTNVRTGGRTFFPSILLGRLSEVDLKIQLKIQTQGLMNVIKQVATSDQIFIIFGKKCIFDL